MAVALASISDLDLGEKTVEKLNEAGLTTVQDLINLSEEELREIPGIGEKTAAKALAAAHQFLETAEQRRLQRAKAQEAEDDNPEMVAAQEEPAGAGLPEAGAGEAEDEKHESEALQGAQAGDNSEDKGA
jgi:NAD-dependent DNA ligase